MAFRCRSSASVSSRSRPSRPSRPSPTLSPPATGLDTAAAYGNEEAVGRAIGGSGIARDELFVTTKLWIQTPGRRTQDAPSSLAAAARPGPPRPVPDPPAARRLLRRRGGPCRSSTQRGLVRAIGVANFYPDRLVDLIEHNEVTPAVNQIETHPFFQRTADQQLMAERGVQIESWGPFAEGRNNLFTDPTLVAIADAHGKSVAQVVLRWLSSAASSSSRSPCAPTGWPKTSTSSTSQLTDEEMTRISRAGHRRLDVLRPPRPGMVSWLGNTRFD